MSHAYGLPPKRERLKRETPKCPECGGWDVGAVGFVHHRSTCSRNPFNRFCSICGLELLAGERRAAGPPPRHLDCAVDLEAHLDEEHSRD
jgi:hypothetical protein